MKPEDKALLELAELSGGIGVTQENQAQLHRLGEDGLMQRDGESHYIITEIGLSTLRA